MDPSRELTTDVAIDIYARSMSSVEGAWSSSSYKESAVNELKSVTEEHVESMWKNIQYVHDRRLNPKGSYLMNGKLYDDLVRVCVCVCV